MGGELTGEIAQFDRDLDTDPEASRTHTRTWQNTTQQADVIGGQVYYWMHMIAKRRTNTDEEQISERNE